MSTNLQEQLQRIASAAGISSTKRIRGKPSLLFSFKEAADKGVDDIYDIAVQGFDQLCRVDPRFQIYRKPLFSQSTKTLDRDKLGLEENRKLDNLIGNFCKLLSSYFLLPAAFKVLEYLIRKFQANERNVVELMYAALPYHATNEFVRLVQTLELERGGIFAFLSPMQETGVAMPRTLLVQRCLTDRGLLRFILDMGQEMGNARISSRVVMPFYGALLCEVLAASPSLDQSLLEIVFPYLIQALSRDVIAELRAVIYMAIVQLASRVNLSHDSVNELVLELSKSASPASLSNVLLVLCHLFASQPELANMSDEAFKGLAKLPTLTTELLALTRKGTRSQVLISVVATAASRNVIVHDNYLRILQDIVVLVPLGTAAHDVANRLMDLASSETVESEQGSRIIAALKVLDQRYPEASDKAMQSALGRFKTQGEEETGGAVTASRGRLLEMLQSAFHDSVRAPLLEAGTSLALAIDASSASIRRVALEKLDALAEKDPEALNLLLGSLLRRLTDENASVVQTALSLRSMSKLPPAAVLESLSLTLSSSLGSALKPVTKKANRADARGVAIKILRFLAGSFVRDSPEKRESVAEQLLTAIFAAPHTRRVAFTAVECASSIGHPLMDGLKGLKVLVCSGGTKSSGWTWKEYDEKTHNREVILALGRQAAKDSEALTSLAALLRSEIAIAQQISLLAANVAMSLQSKSTTSSTMALEIIKWFMAKGQQGCVQKKDTSQHSKSKNVKALVFESETGVVDVECLEEALSAGGKLEHEHLVAAVVQNALELVQTSLFSELDPKDMGRLFSLLAQLPPSNWQQQIQTVVQRISEVLDIDEFLVGIWGSPPEDKLPIAVEAVALKEWVCRICDPDNETELGTIQENTHRKSAIGGRKGPEKHAKSAVKSKADKQTSNGRLNGKCDAVIDALPFLLSAISSPHREVRLACLAGVSELASKADIWWSTNERESIIEDASTGGHFISRDCLINLFRAISSHSSMIEGDGDVAEVLVRSTFEFAAVNHKVIGASPKASNPSTRKAGHAASGAEVNTVISSPLPLPVGDVAVIMTSLVNRIPQMTSPAGLHTVSYILRVVHDSYPPHILLIAAQQLLKSLLYPKGILPRDEHPILHKLLTPLEYRLATEVVALYNDASLIPLLQDNKLRHEAEDGLLILLAIISSPLKGLEVHHSAGSRDVSLQAQAIKVVTPSLFELLRQDEKANLLTTLLATKSLDLDEACRQMASVCLGSLPITANDVIPLIDNAFSSSTTNRHKHPRKNASRMKDMGADLGDALDSDIQRYIRLVEFLQWRLDDITGSFSLVKPVQETLTHLFSGCRSDASSTNDGSGDERAQRLYALQLTVGILQSLAKLRADAGADRDMQAFDIDLAISCAQFAPDAAVRSEALRLISVLASTMPQAVLDHVLRVVTVLENASAYGDFIDAHSINLACQTLTAVGKAWINGGRDVQILVRTVIGAIINAHAIQQLPLLRALETALRESNVPSTSHVIFGLLSHATLSLTAADQEVSYKEDDTLLIALAKKLLQKHDTKAQFVALAELLDLSLGSENAITDPCSPATLSVFRFASSRLSGARSFDGASPQLHSLMATDDGGVQSECEMLMLKGLEQLQRVVEKQTKEQNEDLGALETATEVGYSLVESLRHVMQPAAYISGLITIITKTKDAIQRKALRMLDTFVRELSKISGDGIDKNAGDQPEILSSDGVRAAARDAVRCIQPLLLSPGVESGDEPSELTVQLSFTALGSLAQGVGQWEHDTFLGIIDGVLKRVVDAGSVPLRTGALATLAAIVQGLGMKILPKLPAIVSVVLQSAEKTLESDPQTEDIVELELVAMFSVISSLLHRLGAFIAPNLPQLLRLLFCSRVLSEPSTSKLAQVAALIRNQLPKKVPPRLFLPPMAEWLETVLVTSPEAVHFSIDMVQVSISNLDAKAASSFHQLLFGSMMKVLDVRRRGMATGFIAPEAVLLIEEKASAALVELILKLSEGKFKPLFFRMVEWANATHFPEDSNVAAQSLKGELAKLVRRVAFLSLINALCESLRSVFTPYFHFLMDLIVDILTMEDDAVKTMEARGEEPSLKKQKKSSKKKSSDTLTKDTKQYLMDLYHCRVLAVRALHRCFLYDTSGFLDEARFDRLMTPLVSQLQRAPQSRDFEGAIPADGVIESGSHPENFSEIDVLSRAAICCLSQMALASGPSESRWRPLNHTILMKTRETEAKIRMAALQTAYALANALQEEYLPLLPEALPFLAELLEDPEPEIEAQATATVKLLEEISGEDLKEYLKV